MMIAAPAIVAGEGASPNMVTPKITAQASLQRHSGARVSASPESILTMVVMDSGFAALRRPGMTEKN
jgi:hypothetical protein